MVATRHFTYRHPPTLDQDIAKLAERAWRERLRITVYAERHEPHRPVSIVVREPPVAFGP
jgi:hypothetical protein